MEKDNFDLVLAIPCEALKSNKKKAKIPLEIALSSLDKSNDNPVICGNTAQEIKNIKYDNKSNLLGYSKIFCEQIEKHSSYELLFTEENSNIKTVRSPLLFGQVILYEDEIENEIAETFIPHGCYNFFCVQSKLTIDAGKYFKNDSFNIVYFVVPDINYQDLTLLMDQSHELWCNINGQCYATVNDKKSHIIFSEYLSKIGYKYLGKIYHIVFSDFKQFKAMGKNNNKLFNILAVEAYKEDDIYSHQIELSKNTDEYEIMEQGNNRNINLIKKIKFFDAFNMYSSYEAYASIYSYYYVIKEDKKDIFYNRIAPDRDNEDFSSEANILCILETEIFKITACLVLNKKINEQIKNKPTMPEIKEMFTSFINTRPLFEKMNYYYLGAQKEADFIYTQFRIGDIIADYDRKRELLKNYSEVSNSITVNRNSKVIQFIGMLFTFISGFSILSYLSRMAFDNEKTLNFDIGYIIPAIVFIIIVIICIPKNGFKKLLKKISIFIKLQKKQRQGGT
ncbi:hypothetical protein FACS1894109_07520 [Spirochaetia bacterium]|nr:hypothetical protein FACS1894109_07520 [Spirochaetia bacterium]